MLEHACDLLERRNDVGRLEGHHATKGDALVAHRLEPLDRIGVARRTPSVCSCKRFEAAAPLAVSPEKLVRVRNRDLAPTLPFGNRVVGNRCAFANETEHDVIRCDARVEPTPLVEVDHLIDAVRRLFLGEVGERTAVAERKHLLVAAVESEEALDTLSIEARAAGRGVVAGCTGPPPIDDGL